MSFESRDTAAPEEISCSYGASRLQCRGPLRRPAPGYVAFLGGDETFGRFVPEPFVALVESGLGRDCVNLGCVNGGLDAYLHDEDLLAMAGAADLVVIQPLAAQNLGNRFYRVHPRRNDRFLMAEPGLAALFPEVDFTEFHFINHLLAGLNRVSPERFAQVRAELQRTWVARMRSLVKAINVPALLLWLRYEQASGADGTEPPGELVPLTRGMLDAAGSARVLDIPVMSSAAAGELAGMTCPPFRLAVAERLIGPAMHRAIAARLLAEPMLQQMNGKRPAGSGGPLL